MKKPFKLKKIIMDTFNAQGYGLAHHECALQKTVKLEHPSLRPRELFRVIVSKMTGENLFPFTAQDMFVHFQSNKDGKAEISLLMSLEAYAHRGTTATTSESNDNAGGSLPKDVQSIFESDDLQPARGDDGNDDSIRSGS